MVSSRYARRILRQANFRSSTVAAGHRGTKPKPRELRARRGGRSPGRPNMLLTIALILFVLWALGVFAFKVTAGVIHLVLVVALIVGLVHLFRGRRV
ncbi:hypothetical protein Saro_1105 [Novosphingobium aromaticivorans DSM 12444]|uniref:Lmo0937 family membrane protein n=1 Tax=Novosphingobium aromaticivorans (strain ATCC 700278 / DSM 12444 / CCUG 56034 / CIP 105152 / NBRC 16084 / F199) TaxID=279238 RepID=Q2G9C3_NOVAD|nr:hypothetical protein Saro_1105 [Novosphingobium aromaticivorans DSM 12444]